MCGGQLVFLDNQKLTTKPSPCRSEICVTPPNSLLQTSLATKRIPTRPLVAVKWICVVSSSSMGISVNGLPSDIILEEINLNCGGIERSHPPFFGKL